MDRDQPSKTKQDVALILSAVRALTGAIPPSLISVSVEKNGGTISWQCLFEKSASNEDLELLSAASAELIADFPGMHLIETIERLDNENPKDHLKNLVYLRYELSLPKP